MKYVLIFTLISFPVYAQDIAKIQKENLVISCSAMTEKDMKDLFNQAGKEKVKHQERVPALVQIYDYVNYIVDLCKVRR
jgi:hypothetical protein